MIEIDLTARLEEALKNPGDALWFPDLTDGLVEAGWEALQRKCTLTPATYGTARVMACNPLAPYNFVGCLSFKDQDKDRTSRVEILDGELVRQYEERGIRFYTLEEIADKNVLKCVENAIEILHLVPTLAATIASLVRSLHLIKTEDDEYDVSFSEPHLPFSIFISVPHVHSYASALRVAEAIVHEAMHLHLTLIEHIVPLVSSMDRKYFSPWRGELRDTQGVLHGLYVFWAINKFLCALRYLFLREPHKLSYIGHRQIEIQHQIESTRPFQKSDALTEIGSEFIRRMML